MFITFEGIDASGKSTQLELLEKNLRDKGYKVLLTRQPGGTRIGQQIRKVILDPDNTDMIPETEVLLYMADRLQHLRQLVQPALEEGKIVLCDRYHDALVVYQGAGRQMDLSWLKPIEGKFLLHPNLSFYLDISLEKSKHRLEKRNQTQGIKNCRLESENDEFFKRVIQKYDDLCQNEADRFIRIPAEKGRGATQKAILDILIPELEEKKQRLYGIF